MGLSCAAGLRYSVISASRDSRDGWLRMAEVSVSPGLSIARRNFSEGLWAIVSITNSGVGWRGGSARRKP
jgi:hypothetical protein